MQGILNGLNSLSSAVTKIMCHPIMTFGIGATLAGVLSRYFVHSAAQRNSLLEQKKFQDLQEKVQRQDKTHNDQQELIRFQAQQIELLRKRPASIQLELTMADKQKELETKIAKLPCTAIYQVSFQSHHFLSAFLGKTPDSEVKLTHAWGRPDLFQKDECWLTGADYLHANGQRLVTLQYLFVLVEELSEDRYVCYCLNFDEYAEVYTFRKQEGWQQGPRLLYADYRQEQCREYLKALYQADRSRQQDLIIATVK